MASGIAAFYEVVVNWWPSLLSGALNTLALVGICFPLTMAIAVVIGLARLSRVWLIRALARTYFEFFRGVSVLVTIFWFFFALPFLGISLSPWGAAVWALVLVHGAYASEYVRSTVLGVSKGQFEAAEAVNMSRYQSMRYIIFPQALAAMMPLLGNELVLLLKGTSLASLISVAELTEQGRSIFMFTYQAFPTLIAVLLSYFALAQMLTWCNRRIERRVARWRSVAELTRSLEPTLAAQLQPRWLKMRP